MSKLSPRKGTVYPRVLWLGWNEYRKAARRGDGGGGVLTSVKHLPCARHRQSMHSLNPLKLLP